MRTFKNIIATKAFYVSYGRVMQVKSNEEARECLLMLKETGGIQVDVEDIFHRMRMFEKDNKKYITNATGQEAPTSISRGRNARFSGVSFYLKLSETFSFAKIYFIINMVKKVRFIYATDNYGKTSDIS